MKYYARIIFTNQVSDWFSYLNNEALIKLTSVTLNYFFDQCRNILPFKAVKGFFKPHIHYLWQ